MLHWSGSGKELSRCCGHLKLVSRCLQERLAAEVAALERKYHSTGAGPTDSCAQPSGARAEQPQPVQPQPAEAPAATQATGAVAGAKPGRDNIDVSDPAHRVAHAAGQAEGCEQDADLR